MWQVVTSSQTANAWPSAPGQMEPTTLRTELDELIAAIAMLTPQRTDSVAAPVPAQTTAVAPSSQRLQPLHRHVAAPVNTDCFSLLEIPRAANTPAEPPLAPALREQLLRLRTTILLAAEQRQLRSVLLCSADPLLSAASLAAQLSQLLAEYERLQIAFLDVVEDVPEMALRKKMLPVGYTFQIRHTRRSNLCEIASSLGTVRLTDWLKWWSPKPVLQEMRKRFDLVIISAPAITQHPDVALLASAVDGVILTAMENVTTQAQLATAQQQLTAAQAHVLGVTLEQAPPVASALAAVKARVREMMGVVVKR